MWLGLAMTVGGGLFANKKAKRAAANARAEKIKMQAELSRLENSRQDIVNPYANTKDLSSLAKDLSSMVSNPFASLGVATQAAEIQIEQTDIALANTLDTLRATGASAGGATALAQAALQSKKGVAASIEAQEAQNEKLKAQGEQQMERLQMQEAARIQGVQISEGQRIQTAEAQGKAFMFGAREQREMQKLNRVAGMADRYAQQEMAANQASTAALTGMVTGLSSIAGAQIGAMGAQNAALIKSGWDPKSYRKTGEYIKLG